MRNLKRALSLALASIMVLGLMVVGASAASFNDFTDKDEIKNTEAVNTMVSLGVISGKDDGSYDPTGSLTRAEACTLIARMLSGGKDPVLGSNIKSNFKDTQGHWAETYIAYCANLGIIAGVGDGNFKPNDTLTDSAAAKMVLCALGYKPEFEGIGGANWELATNTLATKIHLYDGLESLNPSETISRDDVAQLIYNGVQADEVEYRNLQGDYSGTLYAQPVNGTGENAKSSSMLAVRFGVVKVTGILLANDVMSIDSQVNTVPDPDKGGDATKDVVVKIDPAKEGWSRLNVTDVVGYSKENYAGLYGKQQYEIVTSNDLVGQEIVLYNNTLSPNASASTVKGEAIVTDKNTVVETASKLKDAAAVKSALKDAGLTIGGTAVKFDQNGRTGSVATGIVDTAGLNQRFIDNDNDGIVEYVIQELPALTKVKNVNSSAETVTFETLGSYDLDDVVCDETPVKDAYMLAISYDGDKLHVSPAPSVEGVITAWDSGNKKITIDGTAYGKGLGEDLTKSGAVDFKDEVGSTYTLYLDNHGNYLGWKLVDASVGNLALVLKSGSDTGVLGDKSGQVQVLLADGTKATYDVNMIDSAKNLGANTTKGNVDTDSKKAAFTAEKLASGMLKNYIISVSLDDNGVATIGFADIINDTNYKADKVAASTDFTKQTTSYAGYMADNNTVFFIGNDTDGYSVLTGINSLSATKQTTTAFGQVNSNDDNNTNDLSTSGGYAVAYHTDANSTKVAKAVVLHTGSSYASNATYAFISGDYVKVSSDYVEYPVVFEDGTTGTLKGKVDDLQTANTVVSYELDSKGVASFKDSGDDTKIVDSKVVTYVGAPAFSMKNGNGVGAESSVVMANDVKIWNVEDTDNIFTESALAKDMSICYITDTDGYVVTVFVMDTNAGFAKVTNKTDATISNSVTEVAAGYKLGITGLTASTEKAVTYTYTVGSDTFTGYADSDEYGAATITMPHNTTDGIIITEVVK